MNYSEMSDFEINKQVAQAFGLDFSGVTEENRYMYNITDYCNSWADAGPIIQQNFIDLEAIYNFTDESEEEIEPVGLWAARAVVSGFIHPRAEDKNPLRAAMIVFLMMNEPKRGGGF